jgi:hypothetical protein
MSDRNESDRDEAAQDAPSEEQTDEQNGEQSETDARTGDEADVPGLTLDPDDDKKALEVDTNVRLDQKDKHRDDVPEDELEKEREERLDPDNRPENTEVDNSQRTFNPETGVFEDSDVEPPEDAPFETTDAEQSNTKAEPKDRDEASDAEESKEATESKDTEAKDTDD